MMTWVELFRNNKQRRLVKLSKHETQALNAIQRFAFPDDKIRTMSAMELHDYLDGLSAGRIRGLGERGIINAKSGLQKLAVASITGIDDEIARLKQRIAELEEKRQQMTDES